MLQSQGSRVFLDPFFIATIASPFAQTKIKRRISVTVEVRIHNILWSSRDSALRQLPWNTSSFHAHALFWAVSWYGKTERWTSSTVSSWDKHLRRQPAEFHLQLDYRWKPGPFVRRNGPRSPEM